MSTLRSRLLSVAGGLLADRALGEPPFLHPVAGFGMLMGAIEGRVYSDRRLAGVAYAGTGVGVALLAGATLGRTSGRLAVAALSAATYLTVAGRALCDAASAVGCALEEGDLTRARCGLPALVGRDPEHLDEAEVARAAVESVAENTVDAVVAPAAWAAVGGAPLALSYRAVNTLDSMVGHRSPRYTRFGWASARADDLAGWVPARITAVLVALVRPREAGRIWRAVRDHAPSHPSPNAGVAEAAFAAALGLELGGTNNYDGRVERRPAMGGGRPAVAADIDRAVRLNRDVTAAMAALLVGLAQSDRSRRWRRSRCRT